MTKVRYTQKWISRDAGEGFTFKPEDALLARDAKPGDVKGDAVAGLVKDAMPDDGQEHLVAVALDAHGVPLAYSRVATGSVDQCPLFARDVYAWALTVPCVRFVGVAHNHPSGHVEPSGPDVAGTAVLAKVGQMLGLDVVWSMVVTHTPGPDGSCPWALVARKGEAPKPGDEQPEPYQPKDPDEKGDEDEDEGEPESDGTPNDTPEDEESDEDGDEDEDEESDGDPTPGDEGDEPDGEDEDGDEAPEPDDEGDETGSGDPDPSGEGIPGRAPEQRPGADVEALRAAVKAAFKLS